MLSSLFSERLKLKSADFSEIIVLVSSETLDGKDSALDSFGIFAGASKGCDSGRSSFISAVSWNDSSIEIF